MESAIQLSLPLFAPPGFDEVIKNGRYATFLSVTVNPRLRRSWKVRIHPLLRKRELIVPPFFVSAPLEMKQDLIAWSLLPVRSRLNSVRKQRSALEERIWRHIESLPHAPRRARRLDADALASRARGERYDLREVFDSVNTLYFQNRLKAVCRWAGPGSTTSCHSLRTDKQGNQVNLISIAGAYNHPVVPRFAIEAIMYHEMLHIAVPPRKGDGRMVVHGRDFKIAERKYPCHKEWKIWEQEHLRRLAREQKRKQKK